MARRTKKSSPRSCDGGTMLRSNGSADTECLLFEFHDKLPHVLARAQVAIDHGAQQLAQMRTQRKREHGQRVTIELPDELIDLIEALLDAAGAGVNTIRAHVLELHRLLICKRYTSRRRIEARVSG